MEYCRTMGRIFSVPSFAVVARLVLLTPTFFSSALAFPLFIDASRLTPWIDSPRSQIQAFAFDKKTFIKVPLQFDEMSDDEQVVLRNPSYRKEGRYDKRKLIEKNTDPYSGNFLGNTGLF